MTKKILLAGGGIAGPVAALALAGAGFEPVVYEAHPRASDGIGAFLTVATNGLAALGTVGLAEAVIAAGFATPRMRLLVGDRPVMEIPMTATDPAAPKTVTLTRGALYGVLRDAVQARGIEVHYGKRLAGAAPAGTGVRAEFADGTSATGDLLVGADGLRSTTRTLIDRDAPRARYVPLLNTGGHARGVELPGATGEAHMHFGRRAFFAYLKHPDGGVWWFANIPHRKEPSARELAAWTPDAWRARLRDVFAEDAFPARAVVDATPEIVPPYTTHDLPHVPTWHRGPIGILGDAAHATSPSSGQGASMAAEDGVVLAACLAGGGGLAEFERLRRPRVEKVVRMGKRSSNTKVPGLFGRLLLPALLRMAPTQDMSWLYDYRAHPVPA